MLTVEEDGVGENKDEPPVFSWLFFYDKGGKWLIEVEEWEEWKEE